MKNKLKIIFIAILTSTTLLISGCYTTNRTQDIRATVQNLEQLIENQPTPKDVDYSLERYNLIRRTYWVNGQREKAMQLPCAVGKPLGYIVLLDNGVVINKFIVDGKVSSLNSFLTGDYYYENGYDKELADIDGSFGENDVGIFFFTTTGQYVEWNGRYLYSDIPFEVSDPVVKYSVVS